MPYTQHLADYFTKHFTALEIVGKAGRRIGASHVGTSTFFFNIWDTRITTPFVMTRGGALEFGARKRGASIYPNIVKS